MKLPNYVSAHSHFARTLLGAMDDDDDDDVQFHDADEDDDDDDDEEDQKKVRKNKQITESYVSTKMGI